MLPLLAVFVASTGCSSEDDKKLEPVEIAWIAKGTENTFFDISRVGAELAADDLSAASGREVTVHLMDPETIDDTDQMKKDQVTKLEEAVAMGVDAINVSVLDVALMTPAIDAAVDAGVPVLTFDSDAPDSKRSTYYGIDNYAGAEMLADALAALVGETGQVAIMSVTSTSQTYSDRMDAFYDAMAKYPDIEVVTPKAVHPETGEAQTFYDCYKVAETERAGCVELLEEAMTDYPEIKGFYLARGRVLRETPDNIEANAPTWAAAVLDGSVNVVAFDAPEDALPSIKAGYAHMTIGQKMFGWGYDLVSLSFDIVTAGREVDSFTDSTFDVICQNNVDEIVDMWRARDFRSKLSDCDLLEQ
jgi:ribose transport system substrate-binding protein